MRLDKFKALMDDVMEEFYAIEADLLDYEQNNGGSTMINERTISSRIGCIIENKLGSKDYEVDVEYNRHGNEIKRLDG